MLTGNQGWYGGRKEGVGWGENEGDGAVVGGRIDKGVERTQCKDIVEE